MFRLNVYSFFLAMLILSFGCAGIQPGVDVESSLKKRVSAYWQHKINKEFSEAYLFESSDIREKVSLSNYIEVSAGGTIWINADIQSVTINGDWADVVVKLTYAFMGFYSPKGGITRNIHDYWHLEDGTWYHHLKGPKKVKKIST